MKYTLTTPDKARTYSDKSGALRAARKTVPGAEQCEEISNDGQIEFRDKMHAVIAVVHPEGTEPKWPHLTAKPPEAPVVQQEEVKVEVVPGEAPQNVTARLLTALYAAFDHFNAKLSPTPLPHPVLVLVPAGRRNALGWMGADRWQHGEHMMHEINLCSDHLKRPFEELMETLIHEMVHMSNREDKIDDCNAQQRHNKKFKARAEQYGLTVEKMGRFGFAKTALAEKAREAVDSLQVDRTIFELVRARMGTRVKGPKTTGVILDDGMKEDMGTILDQLPWLKTRSAARLALKFFAELATHAKETPTVPFTILPGNFPAEPVEEVETEEA